MDKDCNPADPDDNMIIYGHHMKDRSVFAGICDYKKDGYTVKYKAVLNGIELSSPLTDSKYKAEPGDNELRVKAE